MTDYKEEQNNEIEALQSIYCEEFQVIEDSPFHNFSVSIKSDDYDEEETEVGGKCDLHFTYVQSYPDDPPVMEICDTVNIEEDDIDELLKLMNETAQENLGMVMVFTIVSAAQEWLNSWSDTVKQKKAEESERLARLAEEAEIIKFEGTRVTVETFLAWKAKFDLEMAILKNKLQKEDTTNKKLTGRELFEKDQSMNESDIQFMQEGEEEIKVDESLFQDLDDLDLDVDNEDENS